MHCWCKTVLSCFDPTRLRDQVRFWCGCHVADILRFLSIIFSRLLVVRYCAKPSNGRCIGAELDFYSRLFSRRCSDTLFLTLVVSCACNVASCQHRVVNCTLWLHRNTMMSSSSRPAFKMLLAALFLTLVCQTWASQCKSLLAQGFGPRRSRARYSKAMALQDFPNTKRPYKMIVGGDQGTPLTVVQDQIIRGSFPKGTLIPLYACDSRHRSFSL